uniref:Glycosyltransferase n=1 Tax=Ornithogalum saundersiae TaxID=484171 RepID=A0A346D9Z4_9ASPA|nr:aurone glycosyltransferase [Ornithogalum saundersiae]
MEGKKQHVVLFPFMGQGHITPFLLLAELIHEYYPDYTITLVNTPLNIRNLQSSLPPGSKINLKSLPFDASSHGLPPDTENTKAIPFHLFINLFRASETLEPAFERLIAGITEEDGIPPLCIIADNFFSWTLHIARKFGVFHSTFLTSGAYGSALLFSLWKYLPHRNAYSDEFSLPDFPEIRLHHTQLSNILVVADGGDAWSVLLRRLNELCTRSDAVLVNTVKEFEARGLSMLREQLQGPIFPVGPLLCTSASHSMGMDLSDWLDSQPSASVLYVSFGSQNTIRASQMLKLAMALEATSRPFIWVIRPPVGFDVRVQFKSEWLPEGFEDRMRGTKQGFIVHQWAPQVEILSHPSTGAFLSHCGWNSVLESLVHGVPIIGWPLSAEQFYNSKFLMEEVGVCVEAARGNRESSEVKKEEVERAIEIVMDNEEIRRKAKETARVLKSALKEEENNTNVGSSLRGLKEFFQTALSKRVVT